MKKTSILLSVLIISFISCKDVKKEAETSLNETKEVISEATPSTKTLEIALNSKSGSNVTGNVIFTEENGVVKMIAKIKGLEPGDHAIHIHKASDCSSEDGKSAGGHWNPTAKPHGKWGDETGYHKGDIGNFTANEEGNATIAFSTNEWCMGCDDETKNILEKGIIIHAGTDDFTSQPSGAAGARISCAGIIK